jgi:hypothetical protein
MLPCLGFAVERSDLNQPSRRRVGLLNGVFDRYRFRFGGFGHSWHCFGGSDDRTRLGINDDDGALRPLQLRRRADCRGGGCWRRGVNAMVNETGMMHILHVDIPMAPPVGRIACNG